MDEREQEILKIELEIFDLQAEEIDPYDFSAVERRSLALTMKGRYLQALRAMKPPRSSGMFKTKTLPPEM